MQPYGSKRKYHDYDWTGKVYAAKKVPARVRQEEKRIIVQELAMINDDKSLDELEKLEEMYGYTDYEDWWYE
jgi:hypothetical protein